jgi:hypothetical protein
LLNTTFSSASALRSSAPISATTAATTPARRRGRARSLHGISGRL